MTNTLPIKAKVMIGSLAVASVCALSVGAVRVQTQAWPQLTLLLAAAALSSRLKVKLPGITSSMSGNLPVILLAVTQLGFLASLLVGLTAGIAQSLPSSFSGRKPKPIQYLFNVCTLMNATGLAFLAYHSQFIEARSASHMMSLVLAAATFFLANTAPVASIIGLTEGRDPFVLWHKVFLWTFPNYVIGAGLTAIVSAFSTVGGLSALLAVSFAVYQSYKMYVVRSEQTQSMTPIGSMLQTQLIAQTKPQLPAQAETKPRALSAAAGR